MEDANFTLICSDKKKVKVKREKLCAFSKVFRKILGKVADEGGQTCKVSETSADIQLFICVIDGEYENHDWDALHRLTALADKYDSWPLLCAVKLDVAMYILKSKNGSCECYCAAAALGDEDLAKAAIQKGRFKFSEDMDCPDQWEDRARDFLGGRRAAVQNLLIKKAQDLIEKEVGCQKHKRSIEQEIFLRAIALAQQEDLPSSTTPYRLFFEALEQSQRDHCHLCCSSLMHVMKSLVDEWPAENEKWKASF